MRTRALFLRHPWLTTVAAARPSFGPNSLTWTEHGLQALDPLDLTDDARLAAAEVINSFVRGFVAREVADQQALLASGLDADRWSRSIAPYMDGVVASGRHPRFAAIVRNARLPHEGSRERLFETALDVVLAGLERQQESGSGRRTGSWTTTVTELEPRSETRSAGVWPPSSSTD